MNPEWPMSHTTIMIKQMHDNRGGNDVKDNFDLYNVTYFIKRNGNGLISFYISRRMLLIEINNYKMKFVNGIFKFRRPFVCSDSFIIAKITINYSNILYMVWCRMNLILTHIQFAAHSVRFHSYGITSIGLNNYYSNCNLERRMKEN